MVFDNASKIEKRRHNWPANDKGTCWWKCQLDETFVTKEMGVNSILPQGCEATTRRQVIVNQPWRMIGLFDQRATQVISEILPVDW